VNKQEKELYHMAGKTYTSQSLEELMGQMPAKSAGFLSSQVSRRSVLSGIAGFSALGMIGGAVAQGTPADEPTSNVWTPPDDAAPLEEQVWRQPSATGNAVAIDFYESVYRRPARADMFSVPLVSLNKDYEVIPAAATEWSSDETGKVWTFKLRNDIMWSDGNPLTAADYVKTFQYSADPEHAWDFAWFWDGDLLNYTECLAGDAPLEDLGVRVGADDYEVVFEAVNPAPYLPAKLLYSLPLSKAALESTGPLYNTKPETAVSCGAFILTEWVPDQTLVYSRNEAYTGPWAIPLQKFIQKFAQPAQFFTLYDADEVDYMEQPAPAELQLMLADRPDEVHQSMADFACLYFFFDVTKAPFDDLKVRQAFSHVIDRDAMKQQIWGPMATPAPSFLAPGFPASNTEALAPIQAFDPELAKSLLAEAGYPDGEGFPKLVLNNRSTDTPMDNSSVQAYVSMLEEHLGIQAEVQTIDRQAFYDDMRSIQFGFVSYGMDWFDAANMLDIWTTGGRHPWSNAEYDKLVAEGATFLGDPEERNAIFQEAEKVLVTDVPAVFAYFLTPNQLIKPYIVGDALTPDKTGIASVHWPGLGLDGTAIRDLYISKDAPAGRQ
jgi:ABC-type oligopeptide transport system substrate-binding subunit